MKIILGINFMFLLTSAIAKVIIWFEVKSILSNKKIKYDFFKQLNVFILFNFMPKITQAESDLEKLKRWFNILTYCFRILFVLQVVLSIINQLIYITTLK